MFRVSGVLLLAAVGAVSAAAAEPPKAHDIVELERPAVAFDAAANQVPAVAAERPLAPFEPVGKRIYHGVCINAENAADFPRRIAEYARLVGHRPAVLVQFAHAYDQEKKLDWDYHGEVLRTIDREGLIPFLKATTQTWDNRRIPQTDFYFRADDILAGKHDAFFIKAAKVCRDFGKPMFICWNHEMNGDWYSYSENFALRQTAVPTDWTAAKYIEFQRRVWRIFKEQAADNVAFAFAPVLVGRRLGGLDEAHSWKAYYPGDEYVDWLAPSFYNEVTPETFDAMASETNKPIFVSEWGASAGRVKWYNPKPYPGDGAWMARTMELWRQRYPNLKGSAYYQWEADYVVQRTPEQLAAYRQALDDPMFIHGQLTTDRVGEERGVRSAR
jgi:hypothetical protein